MKKLMMAAAAVVGLGIGSVHAAEMRVNFDGQETGALRAVSFDAVNMSHAEGDGVSVPEPGKPETSIVSDDADSSYGTNKEALKVKLDWSIKSAIEYCEKNNLKALKNSFSEMLAHGTVKEKYGFVNNPEAKYVFQNKNIKSTTLTNAISQSKGGVPSCESWGTQKVCISKQTWAKVCTAGDLVCVAGSAIASAMSTFLV